MKRINIKFVFWVCAAFIMIGLLIYVPLSLYLPQKITSQILKRDVKIAEYISSQVRDPLLTRDKMALSLLLHDNLENLPDAEYMFIQDSEGNIVTHTFGSGFPSDLVDINQIAREDPYNIKKFMVGQREFYDLAVPILAGGSDSLHLGVSLKSGKKEIAEFARVNYYVAGAIFAGLGFGFLVLLVISVREAKRVSGLEERNRLAMELHSGLAQSLASVVMRLEICQKLFEKGAAEAMSELEKLKENARELVRNARQAINNLRGS
jgi:hypothetical protein